MAQSGTPFVFESVLRRSVRTSRPPEGSAVTGKQRMNRDLFDISPTAPWVNTACISREGINSRNQAGQGLRENGITRKKKKTGAHKLHQYGARRELTYAI